MKIDGVIVQTFDVPSAGKPNESVKSIKVIDGEKYYWYTFDHTNISESFNDLESYLSNEISKDLEFVRKNNLYNCASETDSLVRQLTLQVEETYFDSKNVLRRLVDIEKLKK